MGVAMLHHRPLTTGGLPEYTYTGAHQLIDDGGGNWRIKFLSSGTLTLGKKVKVDAFLVGGGGGGCSTMDNEGTSICGGAGGGGGYTATHKAVVLEKGTAYAVTIGAGGAGGTYSGLGKQGGATKIVGGNVSLTVNGGGVGGLNGSAGCYGGAGGSGGGGNGSSGYTSVNNVAGPWGGQDGGNSRKKDGTQATENTSWGNPFGKGQGTTTREFGEDGGTLYAGGGGSGVSVYDSDAFHYGGSGGGAAGGRYTEFGNNASANTGGGGGGCGQNYTNYSRPGGNGGSGILILRNGRKEG